VALMKALRTIRFDASDDNVFVNAAAPGELAVSGAFAFAGMDQHDIRGKTRQAFANGWLSLPGLGRATFVTITEADDDEVARAVAALVNLLVEDFGAPSPEDARVAAGDEFGYALELASGKPINTLLTVHRTIDDQGNIREEVREIAPPGLEQPHTRVWDVSDD
jgi:hypothetical protein